MNTQKHDRLCASMFVGLFGRNRKAGSLNRRDWDRFIQARRSGEVGPSPGGVGNRQIESDLKTLMAVLNWATTCANTQGVPLLDRNPLKGLPYPREPSPVRPVMSEEQYRDLLEVAEKIDWRFRLALVLAYETGHRIGGIRQLRWSDVDFEERRVRWRAANDKNGLDHSTPLTTPAIEALQGVQVDHGAHGEAPVFPSPSTPSTPCRREMMTKWMERGKRAAGIIVKGLGWHGLRRKLASDLMHEPSKVLCELGGWKDPQTVIKCYQQPDQEVLREALGRRNGQHNGQ